MIVLYTFLAVIALFFALLMVKKILPFSICVICVSVSLTWLSLLIAYHAFGFAELTIIALLMGQSIVGIYYLLEKKVPERYKVFRLPFLLSATLVAYMALTLSFYTSSLILLTILWTVTGLLYIYRSNAQVNNVVKQLLECCDKW